MHNILDIIHEWLVYASAAGDVRDTPRAGLVAWLHAKTLNSNSMSVFEVYLKEDGQEPQDEAEKTDLVLDCLCACGIGRQEDQQRPVGGFYSYR